MGVSLIDGHIDDSLCISCGKIVSGDRRICPDCETAFIENVELRKDWNLPITDEELDVYKNLTGENNNGPDKIIN
jgi:RNA polymerase subunit RPABC4/transcription elongation factor Spt4